VEWGRPGAWDGAGPKGMGSGRVWDQGYGQVWLGAKPCVRTGGCWSLESDRQTLYSGSLMLDCLVSVAPVGLGFVLVQRVLCGGMCGTKVRVWYGGERHCGLA
jgi:hypothetical protein